MSPMGEPSWWGKNIRYKSPPIKKKTAADMDFVCPVCGNQGNDIESEERKNTAYRISGILEDPSLRKVFARYKPVFECNQCSAVFGDPGKFTKKFHSGRKYPLGALKKEKEST